MDAGAVKQLLQNHLGDCEFHVQGEGSHYDITAIGEVFEGLSPVKKQQLVYGALNECIADGSVHAVNIRTFTPGPVASAVGGLSGAVQGSMSDQLTIALTKGRILRETLPLLASAGIVPLDDVSTSRKLVFDTSNPGVRLVIIRGSDVPTYVRHGVADMGVVGKDILLEHGAEGLYEPLDLGIARCRLMTAGPVGWSGSGGRIRVATKFVNIARRHFAMQGVHADVIKLYGAMELAPIMNLADLIVDIVDTGNTLRANGMEPLEEIAAISSRLVVNKAAMRSRYAIIQQVINDLTAVVPRES